MKFVATTNRNQVKKDYPEAEKIVKVDGGYMVFDNQEEYETWKNQK